MAKKASKTSPFSMDRVLSVLLGVTDPDQAGKEDAETLAKGLSIGGNATCNFATWLQHNAQSVAIIGAGVARIASDLRLQAEDIEACMDPMGPDIDMDRPRIVDDGSIPDNQIVYVGWFDDEEGTRYFGPTDYKRACEMVNSINGNIDIVGKVPTEAEPIERLMELKGEIERASK